jgi:hypothetical protein
MDLKVRFSYEERLKFVRERFQAGSVIKLDCDFTTPPKPKRLLVVAANRDRPLLFIINTSPTDFAKNRPRLIRQHLPLAQADENFLDHDSYLDCSTTYDNFDKDEIEEALVDDTSLILGKLSPETAERIIELVADSPTLSRVHINEISSELATLL